MKAILYGVHIGALMFGSSHIPYVIEIPTRYLDIKGHNSPSGIHRLNQVENRLCLHLIWESPKTKGPNIDPKLVDLLL